MSKTNNLAVLITCHNRKTKTLTCLNALYLCKLPKGFMFDVFLVDDGSTDGTSELVKIEFPEIIIILGDGSLYWNRGMHLAWKTAVKAKEYEYFLWLNDDTSLFEYALIEILKAAKVTNNQSIIIASTCSKLDCKLTYGGFSINKKLIEPSNSIEEVTTFNGNCVLIPHNVYQNVGLIDPLFHHAIGDIDYGLRAKKKGIKSYLAPNFLAFCEGHEKLPNWCLKEVSFIKRLKSLYSPLGNSHPYYYFRFELRHYGLSTALKHLFSIHLRVVLPQLWK